MGMTPNYAFAAVCIGAAGFWIGACIALAVWVW